MISTFGAASSPSSRRVTRRASETATCLTLFLAASAACAGTHQVETSEPVSDLPRAVVFDLAMTPDSALRLARYALGEIEGVVQLPRQRPQVTTIANHRLRNRDGGGQTQVAVIAAVDRRPSNTDRTTLELSVWVLDMPHQLTAAQRRAGTPATPLTTNAPAFRYPRPMTSKDTLYWSSLEHVAEVLVRHGARRLP